MKCKNRFCVIFITSFVVLGLLLSSVAFGGEDQAVLVLQKSGTKVTLLDTFFLDTQKIILYRIKHNILYSPLYFKNAGEVGLEPTTPGFGGRCSTN